MKEPDKQMEIEKRKAELIGKKGLFEVDLGEKSSLGSGSPTTAISVSELTEKPILKKALEQLRKFILTMIMYQKMKSRLCRKEK